MCCVHPRAAAADTGTVGRMLYPELKLPGCVWAGFCPQELVIAVEHLTVPNVLWEELAASTYREVRAAVAAHPQCPTPLLSRLARDDHPEVLEAVACNRSCPPAELRVLAKPGRFPINAMARQTLRDRRDPVLRLIERRSLSRFRATSAARSPSERVAYALAQNPRCPAKTVSELATSASLRVCRAATRHPSCSSEALALAALQPIPHLLAATSPVLDVSVAAQLGCARLPRPALLAVAWRVRPHLFGNTGRVPDEQFADTVSSMRDAGFVGTVGELVTLVCAVLPAG